MPWRQGAGRRGEDERWRSLLGAYDFSKINELFQQRQLANYVHWRTEPAVQVSAESATCARMATATSTNSAVDRQEFRLPADFAWRQAERARRKDSS
jgi:hypothetical protein